MLKENRLKQILEIIQRDGQVQTQQLCQLFRVSDMTIRRDLETLAKENGIVRTHGGAVAGEETCYPERISGEGGPDEMKRQIARQALKLIQPGQKLFIDSGTTMQCLAQMMPEEGEYIIATNDLKVALAAANRENITVHVIGGELRKSTASCYGSVATTQIGRYKVDVAFLGTCAVGEDGYLYDKYTSEDGIKNSIIQSAARTYVLMNSDKFNRYSLISICHVKDITGVITDSRVSAELVERLEAMGVNMVIA